MYRKYLKSLGLDSLAEIKADKGVDFYRDLLECSESGELRTIYCNTEAELKDKMLRYQIENVDFYVVDAQCCLKLALQDCMKILREWFNGLLKDKDEVNKKIGIDIDTLKEVSGAYEDNAYKRILDDVNANEELKGSMALYEIVQYDEDETVRIIFSNLDVKIELIKTCKKHLMKVLADIFNKGDAVV